MMKFYHIKKRKIFITLIIIALIVLIAINWDDLCKGFIYGYRNGLK